MAYIGRSPGDTSVTIARQTYTVAASTQSLFTFSAGYKPGLVEVYLNGVKLIDGTDYTATNGSTITLTAAAVNSDVLEIVGYKAFNLGQVNSSADNFHVGRDLSVGGRTTLSGNLTGVAATFSGNVNVGGVLTYEDVANVDSIGIITARSDIHVLTAGKLLAGTTSARANFDSQIDTAKLQVEGTDEDTSSLSVTANSTTASTKPKLILAKGANASVGGNTIVVDNEKIGEISYQGNDGTSFVTCATITAEIDGTPGSQDMPGALLFGTTSDGQDGSTERLRITSTGDIGVNCEPNSNAGINLHIHGDNASAELRLTNTTTGTGSNGGLLQQSGNNLYLNNTESGNLILECNGSERARITSTGQFNVGSGSFVVESNGDISTNVKGNGHLQLDSTGNHTDPPVKLYSNTGAAEFDNPSGDTSVSIGDKTNTDGRLILTAKTSSVEIHSRSDKNIEFLFNTATKSKMLTDGSLILGTTTATSNTDRLLQVGDTSRSATYVEVRTSTSGASGVVFSDGVDGSNTGYRGTIEYAHSTDGMSFKTNGAQRVTIDSSGNMGVQGNVSASGYVLSGLTALP